MDFPEILDIARKYNSSRTTQIFPTDQKNFIDNFDALDIAIQLVKSLEILHESGYTHNDIKLGNIMITKDYFKKAKATLIDFGYATQFIDKNGNHFKQDVIDAF